MKKNESGRSMVEMLGVLAIIGVLSVGGIAGYTMAMKKYKANEAAHTIAMAAVDCYATKTTTATTNAYVDIKGCDKDDPQAVSYDVVSGGATLADINAVLGQDTGDKTYKATVS